MKCEACGRVLQPGDERERYERGDRDQPSYSEPCCRFCHSSEDDLDRLRDARYDVLMSEAAEQGWAR